MSAGSNVAPVAEVALLVILSCGWIACSGPESSPTAPTESATPLSQVKLRTAEANSRAAGWYPLQPGSRWIYDGTMFSRMEGEHHVEVMSYGEERQITGRHDLYERTYATERQRSWSKLLPFPPPDSTTFWVYYRQDQAGLYEADGAIPRQSSHRLDLWNRQLDRLIASVAPGRRDAYARLGQRVARKLQVVESVIRRAGPPVPRHVGPPGGVEPEEITRLAYPLHPGQQWTIRAVPSFTSRVRGHDIFELPAGRLAGFRIGIESALFGPEDRVEIWYGRMGFLGLQVHFETLHVDYDDPYGVDSLRQITDEYLLLESFTLAQP